MLIILALVIGYVAGFYVNDHFKNILSNLQIELRRELDAIKQKLGV